MTRKTKEEFIKHAEEVHGKGKYDYSLVEYKNNITKVKIICPEHNIIFEKTPSSHIYGKSGCRLCGDVYKAVDKESFIEEAKKKHGSKYDYSEVIYKNTRTKVTIWCNKCKEHFEQTPNSHLKGANHKKCHPCGKKRSAESFTNDATVIHNNKYDYSKVDYKNVSTKVAIVCKLHGEFLQTPNKHLLGSGCPLCAKDSCRGNIESFISRAVKMHGDKYDYRNAIYLNTKTKVKIICNKHSHEFEQLPHLHLSGNGGCPLCLKEFKRKQVLSNIEEFIMKAKKVHPDNEYDYSNTIYVQAKYKVEIYCKVCSEYFVQSATSHLNGSGCPNHAKAGFNNIKPGSLYLVVWNKDNLSFLKYGITNLDVNGRVSYQRRYTKYVPRILYEFKSSDGRFIRELESEIKKLVGTKFVTKNTMPDGYTETTQVKNLPKILDYIKTNYGLNPEDYKYKE